MVFVFPVLFCKQVLNWFFEKNIPEKSLEDCSCFTGIC